MNKEETFEEFLDRICEYSQNEYEGDLLMIKILETNNIHKSFVDYLKWKTSQFKPKMLNK